MLTDYIQHDFYATKLQQITATHKNLENDLILNIKHNDFQKYVKTKRESKLR